MRRSVLFACFVVFFMATPVWATNIGAVKQAIPEGDMLFGVGYTYFDSRWEDGGTWEDLKMQQNLFYAHAGYRFSKNWFALLRGGISTLDADNAFLVGGDLEGEDVMPFVSGNINGVFFDNGFFAIGPFAQGTYYFSDVDDSKKYTDVIDVGTGLETIKEKVTIDDMWEVMVGLNFQIELEGAQLYGGPMYYTHEADIESKNVGQTSGTSITTSKTVDEEHNLGFVAGVQWSLREDLSLELEGQVKESIAVGLILNKRF